ncbi:hypothetical protein ACEVJL_04490 [Pseudoflavonifractor sp. P01025]|uniref:hypothetical protein n=1 Tax=Flintibacter porci TaxID=3342383 RepID=UPI0035B58251
MKQRVTENIVRAIVLTVCSASLFCSTPVLAAENETLNSAEAAYYKTSQHSGDLRYIALTKLSAILKINSIGDASCTAYANTRSTYSCDATLELQQKSGGSWKTLKEWTSSGQLNQFNESFRVTSGYDYRLKISADVYNGGKFVESQTIYSTVVYY